ncbi:MAG: hypothetical protein ACRYFR_17875 [Janthinobacterium lividum]
MKRISALIMLLAGALGALAGAPARAAKPLPVRVVVVTMFERGADAGDTPGEFQYWVERLPLRQTIAFPQGYRDLHYNADKQVLGICTGMGTARSAASVMALGLDPRFDLSHAYWLVAGIAGIDPADGSTGSAVWAEWLVDGDLAHEIDPREMPAGWATGYLPLSKTQPYQQPMREGEYNNAIHLNPGLVHWAYGLTKDLQLPDNDKIRELRAAYTATPAAQQPPRVMLGDHLAAMTYWHGQYATQWANDWVKYWTQGQGNFVTSAMEDTGTGQSLEFLAKAGKVDFNRFLVLRAASNFTMQHPGSTAIQSLANEEHGQDKGYSAYLPALEAAYMTGAKVVNSLVDNWAACRDQLPGQ